MLILSCNGPLVYVTNVSSIPLLQCETVSLLSPNFTKYEILCVVENVYIGILLLILMMCNLFLCVCVVEKVYIGILFLILVMCNHFLDKCWKAPLMFVTL